MRKKSIAQLCAKSLTFKKWSRKPYNAFNSLNKTIKITTLLTIYTIIILPASADIPLDTTYVKKLDIDEVTVSAQRAPVVYSQLARIVTSISRNEIEMMPVNNLNDLLKTVSAIDVRQRGANGIQADISVRGGSFDQNLILLNGINISDPQTGHHSLNLPIDLNSVKRFEILEGPGSRVFGPNAFSGAINIITNDFNSNFTKAGLTAGEYGLLSANLTSAYQFNNWGHYISFTKLKSSGYAKNTDYDNYNLFYHTQYNIDGNKIDFQFGYTDKAFGANSFYTPKYPDQFEQTKTTFTSLKFETGEKIKLTPAVYFRRHQDRFELFREDFYTRTGNYFIKNESDTAKFYEGIYESWNYYSGHNYHLTDVYGAKIDARVSSKLGITSFGAELRSENIWSNVLGNPMSDTLNVIGEKFGKFTKNYSRTISNYFIEHSAYFGSFSMSAGLLASWVNENDFDFNFYPGIEMAYQFFKSFNTYVSLNKSLRLPTFTDLFYSGPENIGNPDLKPEEATSYEWGLKYNSQHVKSSISLFYRDAHDVIEWVRDTLSFQSAKWETQNLTNVLTFGFEFNNRIQINKYFINYISFNYSYLDQEASSKENFETKYSLNYLKHNLFLGINHNIVKNLTMSWNFKYQNRNGNYPRYDLLTASYIDKNYDPFWLIDLKLNWKIEPFNIYAEVTNLLNHQYIEIGNVDMPGRWVKVGFDVRIGY